MTEKVRIMALILSHFLGVLLMTDYTSTVNEIKNPLQTSTLFQVFNDLRRVIVSYIPLPWAEQQKEIDYLTEHHPNLMAKPEYAKAFLESSKESLESFEKREQILDEINCEIIKTRIDLKSINLFLNKAGITRLPVTLFQEEGYVEFWRKLTYLDCSNNQVTVLNLQELMSLVTLDCSDNKLTSLNLQGLMALKYLDCCKNQLKVLTLQGLTALQYLDCRSNQITELNLQRLLALASLYCQNNQITKLNLQELMALMILDCQNNQITALNLQGLDLSLFNCNNNPLITLNLTGTRDSIKNKYAALEKSLSSLHLIQADSDEVMNPLPSQTITFLPSLEGDNNHLRKRTRDEHGMNIDLDESEEDAGHEPEFKRARR